MSTSAELTTDGRVKLMDFGLAKDTKDSKLTQTGAAVGSVFYISPEQARGNDHVDRRTGGARRGYGAGNPGHAGRRACA